VGSVPALPVAAGTTTLRRFVALDAIAVSSTTWRVGRHLVESTICDAVEEILWLQFCRPIGTKALAALDRNRICKRHIAFAFRG
jgi:hypothetical protein